MGVVTASLKTVAAAATARPSALGLLIRSGVSQVPDGTWSPNSRLGLEITMSVELFSDGQLHGQVGSLINLVKALLDPV
jgi:hypothetical protein